MFVLEVALQYDAILHAQRPFLNVLDKIVHVLIFLKPLLSAWFSLSNDWLFTNQTDQNNASNHLDTSYNLYSMPYSRQIP